MEALDALSLDVIATVIGGALLALLAMVFNDKVFCLPELSGPWDVEIVTTRTAYRPFEGMRLGYRMIIWREGAQIRGSGEKIREDAKAGVREYVGEQRTRVEIRGYITRKYLNRSEVAIHAIEHGARRESTTIFLLKMSHADLMRGSFISTAADSAGTAEWRRPIPFRQLFTSPAAG